MDVYDYVPLHTVEDGDQIIIENDEGGQDPVEVTRIFDEAGSVWVKGYSHLTGDNVNYCLPADTEVGLWTA
jgi:hypothetical protein